MDPSRSLPVVMPVVPGQRWSCHSCGECCRTLVGHLFPQERKRLDADGWGAKLGVAPYVRVGREWVLNKRPDGACVFLTDDNRCRIHATFGESAKPLACRIFPFSVRPTHEGRQVTLRFDCPSVTESSGQPIAAHGDGIRSLADAMSLGARRERVRLKGWFTASGEELEGLEKRLEWWFRRGDVSARAKFVVVGRLASALHSARLRKVRGRRFLELVDLLIGGFAAEAGPSQPAPSARQKAMMRQFVLASIEHVTLSELRGGWIRKWQKRAEQLARARVFLRGDGVVPPLPGSSTQVSFEAVEGVRPAADEGGVLDDLLLRYAFARLTGRSWYGGGYYGWPVIHGLGALTLSIVAVGWLARTIAAGGGRTTLSPDDVHQSLRMIDRGATRVRALGVFAERGRIAFLLNDEGIARLVDTYWMVEPR